MIVAQVSKNKVEGINFSAGEPNLVKVNLSARNAKKRLSKQVRSQLDLYSTPMSKPQDGRSWADAGIKEGAIAGLVLGGAFFLLKIFKIV